MRPARQPPARPERGSGGPDRGGGGPGRRPFGRAWLGAGAALVGLLALAGCTGTNAVATDATDGINTVVGGDGWKAFPAAHRPAAPVLAGTTLAGTSLTTASWPGQVVVVNFWASWCSPCRAEAAGLEQVYRETQAQGVRFVGVNFKDDRTAATLFERGRGLTYPSFYDQAGRLALRFRGAVTPAVTPTTIVIDRQGRVAARAFGAVTASELLPVVQATAREPGA